MAAKKLYYRLPVLTEETLDAEAIHSMAPDASLLYVASANAGQDFDASVNHIVDKHLASILSISYGFSGEAVPQGFVNSLNNTFIQAAWAILLGRLTGRDDVVFGVTVAGRPPEIAGVESMVGLFINTLPLRVRLPADKPLITLLREVQGDQSRLMTHQHLGLADIQELAGVGELFYTLVAFENYPIDSGRYSARTGGLRLSRLPKSPRLRKPAQPPAAKPARFPYNR